MNGMEREIVVTADGSHTIAVPGMNVSYHSKHGAIQESMHVFIEAGFRYWSAHSKSPDQVSIFEMGFGTGLNAFLTAIEASDKKIKVGYVAVEQYPLVLEEAMRLNYTASLQHEQLFRQIHESKWNQKVAISEFFSLQKTNTSLENFSTDQLFDLIYYDAFAPLAQPELWTAEVFKKLHSMLQPEGILVTYCSKGDVRRAMQAAGFKVEKIPGPPGKREMVRARINS